MIFDKKNQKLALVERESGLVSAQVVPSDELMIAKLERRIAEMPAKHPKLKAYKAQLRKLTA